MTEMLFRYCAAAELGGGGIGEAGEAEDLGGAGDFFDGGGDGIHYGTVPADG